MAPGHIQAVQLVSRLCQPAWAEGSGAGPSRGVLVGTITFFDSSRTNRITHHLDRPGLAGWCEQHSALARWTSGSALLPLSEQGSLNPGVLSIEVLSEETYQIEDISTARAVQVP